MKKVSENLSLGIRIALPLASMALLGLGCGSQGPEQPLAVDEEHPTEEVTQAACAGQSCGQVLATLDNVPARSNGANMGTGNSCGGSGTYGLQYQCVEYARRYWNLAWGKTFGGVASACNICDLPGLTKRYPYDGYTAKRGDLFVIGCSGGYTYGHVAVVDSVSGGYNNWTASTVEQNSSCGGRQSYHMSRARCYIVR